MRLRHLHAFHVRDIQDLQRLASRVPIGRLLLDGFFLTPSTWPSASPASCIVRFCRHNYQFLPFTLLKPPFMQTLGRHRWRNFHLLEIYTAPWGLICPIDHHFLRGCESGIAYITPSSFPSRACRRQPAGLYDVLRLLRSLCLLPCTARITDGLSSIRT